MTVGEICTSFVVTARPDEIVAEAARRMRNEHVGDVVVVDGEGRPIGMLTDRDIVVSAVAQSSDKLDVLLIGDVMSQPPVTARATETVDEALKKMRARGIRRLPVVSADGRLEGLVSLDDVLRWTADRLHDAVGLVAHQQRRERQVRKG
ncbi:MAG: CBS domain-containing protein [Acidobacteria bacterium]|nr:CBS domain-containing protein [Acidobacteriota bacterium]